MDLVMPLEAAKFAVSAGNKARAETLYSKIIEGKNELAVIAEAAFELSKLFEKQQRFGEALALVKRANQHQPKLDYKTASFKLEQRTEEVKKALEKKVDELKVELKANADKPDKINEIHLQLANTYRESDRRLKAIEHCHEVRNNLEANLNAEQTQAADEDQANTPPIATNEQKLALAGVHRTIAECYYEMKKYDDSIAHCELALQQGDASKPDITILNSLAWNYYKQEKFVKARDLFEQVSDINCKQNGRYSIDEITNQKNIAWCYYELKKRRYAEKHFKNMVNTYRKVHLKERIGIADQYMLLGWFYYDYGCHEKKSAYFDYAGKQFSRALKRLEKVFGEGDNKVKYAVNWIAVLPAEKQKHRKSLMLKLLE